LEDLGALQFEYTLSLLNSLGGPAGMSVLALLCLHFSWENHCDYAKLLREKRLEELVSKERISAVKCGLATILPLEVLSVFSEEDLDLRVCGIPEVDLEYLKVCELPLTHCNIIIITNRYTLCIKSV